GARAGGGARAAGVVVGGGSGRSGREGRSGGGRQDRVRPAGGARAAGEARGPPGGGPRGGGDWSVGGGGGGGGGGCRRVASRVVVEAGVDAECDVVVFVDAPRDQRLKRVRETRGWEEAELERRERAQWALERKRAGSDEVVVNDGDREGLRDRVRALLDRARR